MKNKTCEICGAVPAGEKAQFEGREISVCIECHEQIIDRMTKYIRRLKGYYKQIEDHDNKKKES